MDIVDIVRGAGIVGAGGAGFPTHVKLQTEAECFIVNAAECEPLIETDKYICREYADKVVAATVIIGAHLKAKRLVIALKGKYKQEIDALKDAIQKANAPIEIFEMGTFYPAGDEQIMVQQVTGKSVPERGIPSSVGAVVDNVSTLMSVFDALSNKPVTRKFLSVVGEVKESIMLDVPIGTRIIDCITQAQPTIQEYSIILGGPMMGGYISDLEQIEREVVKKVSGNIIVLPKDHYLFSRKFMPMDRIKLQTQSACIQCRMCTDLCPRYQIGHKMRPHHVMRNLFCEDRLENDTDFLNAFGDAANCCECGACELFACPMGLSPRRVNVYCKTKLRERGIEVPKNPSPTALSTVDMTQIPTMRLIARLALSKYEKSHVRDCITLNPSEVSIPLSQHIGKPAEPIVSVGDRVKEGVLIAQIPQDSLGANIHASIDGTVADVSATAITINAL